MILDFDRNYYDKLKEKYADNPNVRIFSKDDYTLDPIQVPWLYENRGRDLNEIRANIARRVADNEEKLKQKSTGGKTEPRTDQPVPANANNDDDGDNEDDGIPLDALRWTDLHTDDEIASFETRAKTHDPVSGKVWTEPLDPTDPSINETNKNAESAAYIDLDADQDILEEENSDEASLSDFWNQAFKKPLPKQRFASEEEEIHALEQDYSRMQMEPNKPEPMAFGQNDPVPDPTEYQKWQQEAIKRGGNATTGDSFDLPPYRDIMGEKERHNAEHRDCDLPLQHDSLVESHEGLWAGTVTQFSLRESGKFQPAVKQTFRIQTEVVHAADKELHFHTSVNKDNDEVLSSTVFSTTENRVAPCPGRGIAADGTYICVPLGDAPSEQSFSISSKTLKKLVGESEDKPIMEFCLLSRRKKDTVRSRVILFANGSPFPLPPDGVKKKNPAVFTSVMLITESFCQNGTESNKIFSPTAAPQRTLATIQEASLTGQWSGEAILIQPEYWQESVRKINTFLKISHANNLSEQDVSWVEDQFEDEPGKESKRRVRQKGKKKISARVAAARAHDRARLSRCTTLWNDKTGEEADEDIQAWELLPLPEGFSWLQSPRVGRFIGDYCGLVLSSNLLLTFPGTTAHPSIWSTVSLIEFTNPTRRRLVAGRSPEGRLVGALFSKELAEDGEMSDSVSSYV